MNDAAQSISYQLDELTQSVLTAPLAQMLVDPHKQIVVANLHACSLLGVDIETIGTSETSQWLKPTLLLGHDSLYQTQSEQAIQVHKTTCRVEQGPQLELWSLFDADATFQQLKQLNEQTTTLNTIFDESPSLIQIRDEQGRIKLCNHTYSKLYQASPERMIGHDEGDFTGDKIRAKAYRERLIEQMNLFEFRREYEDFRDPDTGQTLNYVSSKKPMLDNDGNKEILIISNDVSELAKAKQTLEKSEKRLSYILDAIEEGIWDWHMPTDRLSVNQQWHNLAAIPSHEFAGTIDDFMALIHTDDKELLVETFEQSIESKKHFYLEHRIIDGNGLTIWVQNRGRVVEFDNSGEPIRMVGAMTSIEHRKHTEEALQQAKQLAERSNRSKSEFLANISHEIRTPLSGVIGMVDNLIDDKELPPALSDALETIKLSGEEILHTTNEILDLSKLESDRIQLETTQFSPLKLLQEVEAHAKPDMARLGIELRSNFDNLSSDQFCQGDYKRLKKVLLDLLHNSQEVTKRGWIELRAKLKELDHTQIQLEIEIQDTSPGLTPEEQLQIFEPFSDYNNNRAHKTGGSGLGLAIDKKIIDLMQGQIGIQSNDGLGSTYWFKQPLTQVDAKDVPQESLEQDEHSDFSRLNIMIVEDNLVNQKVILALLKKLGCGKTYVAENGEQALMALKLFKQTNLILMDCQMPVMDGFEASERIRRGEVSDASREIPIIAITAKVMPEDKTHCIKSGMNDFLSKPFDFETFQKVLKHYIP